MQGIHRGDQGRGLGEGRGDGGGAQSTQQENGNN